MFFCCRIQRELEAAEGVKGAIPPYRRRPRVRYVRTRTYLALTEPGLGEPGYVACHMRTRLSLRRLISCAPPGGGRWLSVLLLESSTLRRLPVGGRSPRR